MQIQKKWDTYGTESNYSIGKFQSVIDGGDLSPIAEDEQIHTKWSVTKRK
jgi:hypothetical protein